MKIASLVLVLLLGLLLLSAMWVRAEATNPASTSPSFASLSPLAIPVSGVEVRVGLISPGTTLESDGIEHIRDRMVENNFIKGKCGGESCSFDVPFVRNSNQNLATGDGELFGSFAYVTDGTKFTWGTRVGRFDGRWWGTIDGATGVITIHAVAQGSGDFDGMVLMLTSTVPPPAPLTEHPTEGVILVPHG